MFILFVIIVLSSVWKEMNKKNVAQKYTSLFLQSKFLALAAYERSLMHTIETTVTARFPVSNATAGFTVST